MNPLQEQELVERAKTDDSAFTELYNYYLPRIYGYINKRVGDQALAEDLTSQTFIKMVEHLQRFDGMSFKSWLYRIATNTVIDHIRTHRPIDDIEDHLEIAEKAPTPDQEAMSGEERDKILHVLTLLPEKYSRVLHLKFYADLSNEEIAASLEITVNNLGVLVHRALKSFQTIYTKYT